MKRVMRMLSLLLAILTVVSFAACGGETDTDKTTDTDDITVTDAPESDPEEIVADEASEALFLMDFETDKTLADYVSSFDGLTPGPTVGGEIRDGVYYYDNAHSLFITDEGDYTKLERYAISFELKFDKFVSSDKVSIFTIIRDADGASGGYKYDWFLKMNTDGTVYWDSNDQAGGKKLTLGMWHSFVFNIDSVSGAVEILIDGESVGKSQTGVHLGYAYFRFIDMNKGATVSMDNFSITKLPEAGEIANGVKIMHARGGADAIVTIVHDDGTWSTGQFLDEQFEKNGLKGTVAMVANRVANADGSPKTSTVNNWQSLLDTGRFDIACHTYNHKFCGITDEAQTGIDYYNNINNYEYLGKIDIEAGSVTREIVTSGEVLREIFPDQRVLAFVKAGTPGYKDENGTFTQLSPYAMELVKQNYIGMRVTNGDVETIPAANNYGSKCHMVKISETGNDWIKLTDEAIQRGGWITYLFHNIVEDSAVGGIHVGKTNAATFFTYVGEKVKSGEVWCTFLEEAMQYTQEYGAVEGEVTRTDDSIRIRLTDTLDDDLYDCPLTVRVEVPEDWTAVSVAYDGETYTLTPFDHEGKPAVYVDIIPDIGSAVLTKG